MLFYLIFLHLIVATPQLNLHYTNWVSESKSESDNALQHNCLRFMITNDGKVYKPDIIFYCMSELPSKFNIEKSDLFSNFTFAELSKQNITSQDLYRWSTPIDIIEDYQLYLNELLISSKSVLATKIHYNCTMPRFGPMCQYELPYHHPNHSSLNQIISNFYRNYGSYSNNLTCYIHLQCNRGPHPVCLDWSEICNGKIDCFDNGIDEEHCWQLEINQCKDNEYRCRNGQCIPQSFVGMVETIHSCVDGSDIKEYAEYTSDMCYRFEEPSIQCEDKTCGRLYFTSSCTEYREEIVLEMMYSRNNNSVSEECWSAFECLIVFQRPEYSNCNKICKQNDCKKIVMNTCPNFLFLPNTPVLFSNIYFVYKKDDLQNLTNFFAAIPPYICYYTTDYDRFFFNITKAFIMNNMTCVHSESFLSPSERFSNMPGKGLQKSIIYILHNLLQRYHLPFNYTSVICDRSNMYQCLGSSKCISIYRLMDNIIDCPYMDDENMIGIKNNTNLIRQLDKTHFKCEGSNKYIHPSLLSNAVCNCDNISMVFCEDENLNINYVRRHISFQYICDGLIHLLPISNGERNETDETECEQWPCSNTYTRCDGIWNCPNGADESGCHSYQTLHCSSKHHFCVTPDRNELICLPIEKANDGHIDCLGATDEPALCKGEFRSTLTSFSDFYCMNESSQPCISSIKLCNGYPDCRHGDDEQFCTPNQTIEQGIRIFIRPGYVNSDAEKFLCSYTIKTKAYEIINFKLHEMIKSVEHEATNIEDTMFPTSSIIKISNQYQPRCHRGLDLRIWLNNKNNSTKTTCLCPPQYYGDRCQYQNQRISLSIQFQALSDSWQTLFAIVIFLIDDSDQRIIHSYEQINYLSRSHCQRKFNIYLLYSTRPKSPLKNYAIHVDIYEKESLTYRGSLLYPVTFPFLPVHRLAFIVNIPSTDNKTQSCSNDRCIHGKCIKYYNNSQNLTFCRCDQGWSGRYCTIQYNCTCSSNLSCIGISSNNQSICVCPMNRFGPRCLLTNMICRTNNSNSTCQNGGQCIPYGDYLESNDKFVCICSKGYSGNRCEITDNKLILSFDKNIVLSQSIFIHFFEVIVFMDPIETPIRATTFQTIPFKQDSITIYWSKPFHLVFTELYDKIYYLTVVQKSYEKLKIINRTINPSDRCLNISELFNKTFLQWPLIRRIKYYHLPCQNQSLNLSCFHDKDNLCLCYNFEQQRLANCFTFNHSMKFDCLGRNECENGAQCLQDDPRCPTKSLCICPPCFYGRRCQFSTSGFGLSLDAILSYHIIPDTNFSQQQSIIKISLAMTIIFIMIGFVNGILCIITFKNKIVREVGCGLYLLGTSITTLLTMIMFGLKFFILLFAQMTPISNRLFLQIQCHSIDFLLRICLCTDQWLDACVAIERAITVIKGVSFDKKKSKRTAQFIIVILLIGIIVSLIHDPIYRHLIDEENDYDNVKRIWCVVTYSSSIKVYDYFIHSFHFFCPFLINLFSSIILITKKSRQQLTVHRQQSYKEILRKQIREHKHLLTGPVILFILALPRLIITFISKCMKSTNDTWLFLIGYFISFIPSMLTFLLFIVPSKFYKKEFRKTITQYRNNIQRYLPFSL